MKNLRQTAKEFAISNYRLLKLALAVAVLGITLILLKNFGGSMESSVPILKIGFPYKRLASEYEPTKIHLSPEYIFLENIYSPLIELSKDNGGPISSVAEEFQWVDDELHFKIREGLKTIDGYIITAKDAEFSLKRLLVLSENTHGNFKDIICSSETIKSVNDHCSGIEVRKNVLVLKPGSKRIFLLKMLAAIDFAIIPIPSVDLDTLKIKDYRNTSGLYYVESDGGNGDIVLSANKSHFRYSPNVPQTIRLVPTETSEGRDSLALFESGEIDYITTVDGLTPDMVLKFAEEHSEAEKHVTMNIRTFVASFTPKAIEKLSAKTRLEIGKTLKKVFREHYKNSPGVTLHGQCHFSFHFVCHQFKNVYFSNLINIASPCLVGKYLS